MKRVVLILFLFNISISLCFAEVIYRKNGTKIEAEIIERTEDYIKVDFHGVTLTYWLEEIEYIEGEDVVMPPASNGRETLRITESQRSVKPLDNIYQVARDLGYSPEVSEQIAQLLLPLYNKIHFRNTKNIDTLKEDLETATKIIGEGVFDEQLIPYPSHQKLYTLFTDDKTGKAVNDLLLSAEGNPKAMSMTLFMCVYESFVASIIFKAKGLDARFVFVWKMQEGMQPVVAQWEQVLSEVTDVERTTHASCLIRVEDESIFADAGLNCVSSPFVFDEIYWPYTKDKKYFKLMPHIIRGDLYKEIYMSDACIGRSMLYGNVSAEFLTIDQPDKAFYFSDKAVKLDPHNASLCYDLGLTLHEREKQKALTCYKKAVELNPRFLYAYMTLGEEYTLLKEYQEAITFFKKVIQIDSNFAEAYDIIGFIYYRLRQGKEAREYLSKARELYYQQGEITKMREVEAAIQAIPNEKRGDSFD